MAKHDVESEVTGNVWKVLLETGATVAAGDVIIILESMKMEIPVIAEESGTISRVAVSVGDVGREGDLIVSIS